MWRNSELNRKSASFKNFCKWSTLNSFKYLQDLNRGFLHILIWACVNMVFIGMMIVLITILWNKLTESPTVISLESSHFPISHLPFPAISICDINKISKKKAKDMASYIANSTNLNIEVIKNYIQSLGSFYDFDVSHSHKLMEFQKILEKVPHSDEFKATGVMKLLAPSCDEFLKNCSWKGSQINCNEIFQMRLTFDGYCCVFNYVKKTVEISNEELQKEIMTGEPGLYNGLTVTINNQLEDYFYSKQESLGANVHVFLPTDYPDKNSGSLSEYLVGVSTEFLLEIGILSTHTVKDVINYPIEKRQCYFQSERHTRFGVYSESDCLVSCRIRSMLGLCGCVPFMIPMQNQKLICGFSDTECLHKYRLKWESLSPPNALFTEYENLLKEAHYSLSCEDRCYPACDSVRYDINTNPVPLGNPSYGNNSILRIYYASRYSTLFKQDVVFYWFEIMSNFGGTFGLMLGFSLVSAVEILMFIICNIYSCIYSNLKN